MGREVKIEGKYLVDANTSETLGRVFVKDGVQYTVPLDYNPKFKDQDVTLAKTMVHEGYLYIRLNDII
jgi:hypothetical protein